jgi:fused signal recognition particle receptor
MVEIYAKKGLNAEMSWFKKIKDGLSSSSSKITEGISAVVNKRKLDSAVLENLEDLLITADMGVAVAADIIGDLRNDKFGKEASDEEIKEFLAEKIAAKLEKSARALEISASPFVVLVVGVNGNGKTTSVGKLANFYREEGKKVSIIAADTFRAAAVEQLAEWARRAKVPMFRGADKQEPASVIFQGLEQAKADGTDIVFVDTAGRLQNKVNLMSELEKITKICERQIEGAPHETVLVLDATTGQNAISQVEEFRKTSNLSGLIVTKLDGTAKGGIVVALAEKFELPIFAIGLGEGIDDLKPFNAMDYARGLVGL